MSLAREIFEEMVKKGQVKQVQEPLPSPHVGEGLPADSGQEEPETDPVKGDQPEPGTPGPLFGGSIEEDQPEDQGVTPQSPCLQGVPSDEEIDRIRKPIPILSQYLDGKVVYLVRDEEMAQEVEKQGKVAFTPEEIRTLTEKFHSMDRDAWVSFLKAICLTKKTFEGSKVVE
ncbi:MAG: hypothetical protein ABSH06_14355 [Thermodesulfobacteriota bacterium]|jgi:hypothetical protein